MSSRNNSPLPETTSASFASIDSDCRHPKVSERKPSLNARSSKEKPVVMRVSEMLQSHLREELKRTKEELSELKEKKIQGLAESNGRIMMLEAEAEKAKDSEMKMLESLVSQTKQLEQTKILLEEGKLEIRKLQGRIGDMENSAAFTSRRFERHGSIASVQNQEELRKLRNELRLALEAEEKGKKAMDDLAIILAEVTTEATHAKAGLAAIKPELEKSRDEAALANSKLKSTKQNLQEALKAYEKLKLEHEESAAAWKAQEDGYKNCIKYSEEEMHKKDQERSKLSDVLKLASEENFKLRDIITQAVNEAKVAKESLEIAQRENGELNEQLSKKENDLQQLRMDYESLKVSEASALQSLRELNSILASDSANSSNKASNLTKVRSFRASNVTVDDSMINKSAKNRHSSRWSNDKPWVHSSRWSNENPRAHNCHGHGLDVFNCLAFDKDGSFEIKDKKLGSVSVVPEKRLPSSLFVDHRRLNPDDVASIDVVMLQNAEIGKQKRKKTIFERFSDSMRRKSFLKS